MKRTLAWTAGALALALSQICLAQNAGLYLGANVGQSKYNIDCGGGLSCDDSDTAFKLYGGYKFHPNWSAELGYADLGKAKLSGPGGTDEMGATAWDLTGVFQWPIAASGFSIFGRAGLYLADMKLSGPDHGKKTSSGLTFGLGAEYDFTRSLGVRAEWQRYAKVKIRNDVNGVEDDGDVDALTLGLVYRF